MGAFAPVKYRFIESSIFCASRNGEIIVALTSGHSSEEIDMLLNDKFNPKINVAIGVYKDGKLIDKRLSHNVVTNTGRAWLSQLVGSGDYSQDPPLPHNTDKIGYIGFGCGGALQTDQNFAIGQSEMVTVTHIQDPVPIADLAGGEKLYLKRVSDQAQSSVFFPGDFRTRFIVDLAEGELSYPGNATRISGHVVGTSVPITEAGLYLTSAGPSFNDGANTPGADPAGPNGMVAYNVFDPIFVTPNVVLRVEWELRF